MSQNQEIIEAKLCAYIDGELDSDGRAEIEKHLESNPQHRRLLESLKATRDLLRWLPREGAPPEIGETLNGQLERSVLLDGDMDRTLWISRWPRVFAAAAIIILTTGLAVAVWFALPKGKQVPYAVNNRPEAAAPSASVSSGGEMRSLKGGEREGIASKSGNVDEMKESGSLADSERAEREPLDAFAKRVFGNTDGVAQTDDVTGGRKANHAIATDGATQTPVLLVRANDTTGAATEVTRFLESNQIAWRPAPEPMPAPLEIGPRQQVEATHEQETRTQLREDVKDKATARGSGNAVARDVTVEAAKMPSVLAGVPATRPDRGAIINQKRGDARRAPDSSQMSQAAAGGQQMNGIERAEGLYVARMSRRQAEALRVSISRAGAQTAELIEPVEGQQRESLQRRGNNAQFRELQSAAPTTGPAALEGDLQSTLAERVRSEAPQLMLRNSNGNPATRPADQKPQGPTNFAAEFNDTDRANSAPAPQTQSSTATAAETENQPATKPSESVAETSPATQPADDEPLNVVIVVEPTEAAGPPAAAPPATEPAAPATQPTTVP